MIRRGDQLREHILKVAKNVFLELGFERTSMDVVAARSETTKRTVYAHFESKEKLFLAVIERTRGRFLAHLKVPSDYAEDPEQALTLFCGRYLEILLHEASIQMIRVSVAAADRDRFSEQSALLFDVLFVQVHARISTYLEARFELKSKASDEAAHRLLGGVLYPGILRALFGVDVLAPSFDREALSPDFNLKPIRKAVALEIKALQKA